MDITTFDKTVKTENSAKKYLLGFCWKNHQRYCPRCRQRKVYLLAGGRRRCSRCGYTFHDFSRRFINVGNLSCQQWLWLIKLFELDVPSQAIARQLGLAYNTAAKAMMQLRRAILAQALDGTQLVEAGLMTPRPENAEPLVFGIFERGGWVFSDLAPDLTPGSIDFFKERFFLKTAQHANIVYTDKYRHYDTLLYCEHPDATHPGRHKDRNLYVDGRRGGFWIFIKDRLRRARGLSPTWFPFYLKEFEFRYNHRNQPLFTLLVERICHFVPEHKEDT